MMGKRAAYVCMIGMSMTIGLTACQKSDDSVANADAQIIESVTETDGQIVENAHILAETEKSYISINVLGDLSGISDVNDERLELLADAFDFSAIP